MRWLLAALAVAPAVIILVGALWWRASLPRISGAAAMPGASAEIRVIRDRYGVPHIFAANLVDAWRAAGYVHAQDRLAQMDLQRRVTQGRLSAIVGAPGLTTDKLFLTLDLAGAAKESLSAFSADARAQLDAYAEGVNQWLAEGHALPAEYSVLGFEPEPWRPEDSLLWGKAMAWKLSANWRQDARRARLAARMPIERLEKLFPKPLPGDPATIEPRLNGQRANGGGRATGSDLSQAFKSPLLQQTLAGLLALPATGGGGSNEWAVDGRHSETGKPLLANDPHLELGIPILWYLMRITTPDITLAGATASGAPVMMLGQNGHIAWGFTTTESDTQDLFLETIDPQNPDNYLTPEGSQPFSRKIHAIAVKNAAPVSFTVRGTRHGPVISDAIADAKRIGVKTNQAVALAWTGFSGKDATAEALMRVNAARNWDEFRAALKLYHAPTQNLVYADGDGNIGFINPGAVPLRKSGDGRYPADGASGAADWTGDVPAQEWPQLFNPAQGAIVNANNAVAGPSFPHWLGYDHGSAYRAGRIIERLQARPKHSLDTFAALQMDAEASHARTLLPLMLNFEPQGALQTQAMALLKAWDFHASAARPEPLIFDWWLRKLNARLLSGELQDLAETVGVLNASAVENVLRDPAGFCPEKEGKADCAAIIAHSFAESLAELASRHGPDPQGWRWGREHIAAMPNRVMDFVPGFRRLFDHSFGSDGGFYSVNRGGNLGASDPALPMARESGAGFRGLYDLGDPAKSRFIIASGQSGHPLSPFYANLLPLWREGAYITLLTAHDDLLKDNAGILTLKPR